ncbi:hypothetical protein DFA_08742 [Cavenderia fasciculata]|uniref:Uncharacterized protein n=1 Tax=Cavenderia fasciculata TaxID=261658 RepID=F4Q3Y7_CACFS|nr:uncharacterized protein DFA_08742 [Cavenderia fasciculata]EGG17743.1 hypothetical protein DFA_08742 [Cavenderia fasciculata]|eukprot:XP_004356227.1 hypothetical protein DFA_08742 [Cavenderia fasciculata]
MESKEEDIPKMENPKIEVSATAILVCAARAVATNKFIRKALERNDHSMIQDEIVKRYYTPKLDDSTVHENLAYYDPYSFIILDCEGSTRTLENFVEHQTVPPVKQDLSHLSFQEQLILWKEVVAAFGIQTVLRRTKLIDSLITNHVINGDIEQIVVFGAGMDMRAHRMKLAASVTVYELDMPKVIELKKNEVDHASKVIEPISQSTIKYIGIDLSTKKWIDNLLELGFDANKPTFWIMEGLLMYLKPSAVDDVFQGISQLSCRGSALVAHICKMLNMPFGTRSFNNLLNLIHSSSSDPTKLIAKNAPYFTSVCHYTFQDIGTLFSAEDVEDNKAKPSPTPKNVVNNIETTEQQPIEDDFSWYAFAQQFQHRQQS